VRAATACDSRQHAHDAAFEQAFVLAGADRREQHEDARREREPEHDLHDLRDLVGGAAHLFQYGDRCR
jgi:hypothetical protein